MMNNTIAGKQHTTPIEQTVSTMNTSLHLIIFLSALCFVFFSCASVKPVIIDIPNEDITTTIFYRDGESPSNGGSFLSRKCTEPLSTSLFTTQSNFIAPLFDESTALQPSLSADGSFLIVEEQHPPDDSPLSSSEKYFYVLDIKTGEKVFETKTQLPCNGHSRVAPSLQWSIFDNSFFYSSSDTIYKCYTDGKQKRLGVIEGIKRFSVSPSEEWLLFVQEQGIGLINLTTQETFALREFEEVLGINFNDCVDIVSWSLDETFVSFSEGKRIFIYTIANGRRATYRSVGTIYALEWLPNNELVFVEGNNPAKHAILHEDIYYKMFSLNPLTMDETLLHEQRNQSPEYVKPKLSPSQTLLLFSERDIQGTSLIQLMTLDGTSITTVCNGHSPMWGK
ncbi:MAG: hypothetical protein HY960_05245 [Ignavibacteriae bacterium]|nr:hypothetical protein [Ignavibacteriota bacterium]